MNHNEIVLDAGETFVKRVKRNSILTHERLCELFGQYKAGNYTAYQQIYECNLRLVNKVAMSLKKAKYHNIPLAHLISMGSEGLELAIEKYNPNSGNQFSTFATPCVRWTIFKKMDQYDQTLHKRHTIADLRQLEKIKDNFYQTNGRFPNTAELCLASGYNIRQVNRLQNTAPSLLSLDCPDTLLAVEYQSRRDFKEHDPANIATDELTDSIIFEWLKENIEPRKLAVFIRRAILQMPYSEIGLAFHVTRSRAEQIVKEVRISLKSNPDFLKLFPSLEEI